jgi:hypothetical protein
MIDQMEDIVAGQCERRNQVGPDPLVVSQD